MKKIFTFCLLALSHLTIALQGQPCTNDYTQKIYNVYKESNITYGSDTNFNASIQTLKLNIWKPLADNNTLRPLIILVHGGGFVSGQKEDFDTLASWYAARGYVAATIQYRLLFYPPLLLTPPYAYDSTEVLRAGYRSIQDLRGAIRFMKNRATTDSSDINHVYVLGGSAGAIAALGAAYIDQNSELPFGVDSIAAVVHGPSQYPRPHLGPLQGKLNLGNSDASFHGVVSYMGAMLDTAHLESSLDMPLFLYHQTGDPIVGCNFQKGLHGAPLGLGTNYPHLYGSCLITPRAQNLSFSSDQLYSYIHNGNNHSVHNQVLVDSLTALWLSKLICPIQTSVEQNSLFESDVIVYPNPSNGQFRIKSSKDKIVSVDFYNTQSELVKRNFLKQSIDETQFDLTDKGIYFMVIQTEKQHKVIKIVVL
ncbi:MAG TPA: T9SS type A sorting domain-containing protein [Bacteroidia bacterium]|nr:T9SS type A sorting domain-containing protein [Bacteroidia bacterium]HNT80049.1 T9SS type A sorting domain-containing protein [Bacteroidia bacterium]